MAIPSQKQTFGLENCRDLLLKLEWEIEGLKNAPTDLPDEFTYRAFNGFVTAWHLADWVWKGMTEQQRKTLRLEWKCPKMNAEGQFAAELQKKSRALAICRQIATASKHVEVTKYPDETVDAITSAEPAFLTTEDGGHLITAEGDRLILEQPIWVLKVSDGREKRPAVEVLDEALDFWTSFIYGRGICQ
jgi:hypothetical protein